MKTLEKFLRESAMLVLVASALLIAAGVATAQVPASGTASGMSGAEARMRYEQRLAQCNIGTLPAPDRMACVRNAGQTYDLDRAGQPAPDVATTNDGRATVIRPPAVPARPAAADTSTSGVTSADGRATIIAPPVTPQ